MIRALLLALVALLSLPAHAYEWSYGSGTYASPQAACATHTDFYGVPLGAAPVMIDASHFRCEYPPGSGDSLGSGTRTGEPEPDSCATKQGRVFDNPNFTVPVANLGVTPTGGCNGGCRVNFAETYGSTARWCNTETECYWGGGARGSYNGAECTNQTPETGGGGEGGPVDPEDPEPIDPEDPPPGCKNLTDPSCGPIEETEPGCKKTTTTTPTGGVKETTVCKKTVCGPSKCKTTSTSVTNSWNSGAGYRRGDPPDSREGPETEEKEQPRCSGGKCTGNGGGTGGGGTGGSDSSGLMDADGDGFMDGDTDKNGTCDVRCGSSGGGTGNGGGTGGGGTGGGGGGGKGNGNSYCEENPDSDMCPGNGDCEKDDMKGRVACMKPGTLEPVDIPTQTKNLQITPSGSYGPSTAACPPAVTFSVSGRSFQIGFDLICEFAEYIRPLVIGFAWFSAAMTFFGFARRS